MEKQPPFLALTAIDEFWDISKPIVFLGRWCCRYSKREVWEPLAGEIVRHPWSNRSVFLEASEYIKNVYEKYLVLLAEALNKLHNVTYSIRFWRIVVGPWLEGYLSVIYERYIAILNASEQYPGFITMGLSEKSFVTPCDTNEFFELIKDDYYNLQIYTKILTVLGKDVIRMDRKYELKPNKFYKNPYTLRSRIRKATYRLLKNILWNDLKGKKIVLSNSYFSRFTELMLWIKSGGKVWSTRLNSQERFESPVRQWMRLDLGSALPTDNEFNRLLKMLLPYDLPICFVECFEATGESVSKNYPANPYAIFSANSWYYDELFKRWAANSAENNGVLLLGVQHGGNYGSIAYHSHEEHEKTVVDKFFSWGWKGEEYNSKIIPFIAPKFVGRKKVKADNAKEGIFYVTTNSSRYFMQFNFNPNDFEDYLQWQCRFIKSLESGYKRKINLRIHYEDGGWDILKRWDYYNPDVKVINWRRRFLKGLKKSRLFVCDNLSTTFIEALSINKPSVLFWDPSVNELRPEAEAFYNELRDVGILYDNPESAAAAVSEIYQDVESWWDSRDRQEALNMFCSKFARISCSGVSDWTNMFAKIINGNEVL